MFVTVSFVEAGYTKDLPGKAGFEKPGRGLGMLSGMLVQTRVVFQTLPSGNSAECRLYAQAIHLKHLSYPKIPGEPGLKKRTGFETPQPGAALNTRAETLNPKPISFLGHQLFSSPVHVEQ